MLTDCVEITAKEMIELIMAGEMTYEMLLEMEKQLSYQEHLKLLFGMAVLGIVYEHVKENQSHA